MHGFKIGDSVFVHGQHAGRIIKLDTPVKYDNNTPGALVEFDNKKLIPPQMAVSYKALTLNPSLPSGQSNITSGSSGNTNIGFNGLYGFYGNSDNLNKSLDVDATNNCPKCGAEWKETWVLGRAVYDCVDCNIKREDVLNEKK